MKIIKYRVYDKEKRQMSYTPVSMNFSSDGHINGVALFTNGFTTSVIGKDGMEWMQYTGLKDKNGKEIYEGDILRWWVNSTSSFAEELLEVKWGSVGWVLKSPLFESFGVSAEDAACYEHNTFGYTRNSEIIGNIYENPELLNPTNKE